MAVEPGSDRLGLGLAPCFQDSGRYLGKVTPARSAPAVDFYTSDTSQLTSIKGLPLEGPAGDVYKVGCVTTDP